MRHVIREMTDRYGCPATIVYDDELGEYWWEMEDETEGPFDTREDAISDLSRR